MYGSHSSVTRVCVLHWSVRSMPHALSWAALVATVCEVGAT